MKLLLTGLTAMILSNQSFALTCVGAEPFWGAEISKNEIVLELTGQKRTLSISDITSPFGMPNTENSFVRIFSDRRGPVATIISKRCNLGTSDSDFLKEIIIYTSNGALYGCCDRRNK